MEQRGHQLRRHGHQRSTEVLRHFLQDPTSFAREHERHEGVNKPSTTRRRRNTSQSEVTYVATLVKSAERSVCSSVTSCGDRPYTNDRAVRLRAGQRHGGERPCKKNGISRLTLHANRPHVRTRHKHIRTGANNAALTSTSPAPNTPRPHRSLSSDWHRHARTHGECTANCAVQRARH